MNTFLGIDGGGTNTRALLVDSDGKEISYKVFGPSNPHLVGEVAVASMLKEILENIESETGHIPTKACIGLAGVCTSKIKESLAGRFEESGLKNFILLGDAELALHASFPEESGILLIAGTGSVCLGKDCSGNVTQTGGLGWLADDAGSAGWIGQKGLEIAIRQHDLRAEGSALKEVIFNTLQIRETADLVPKLYSPTLTRSDLSQLAPLVIDLAANGDTDCAEILHAAVSELAKLVRTTANKLQCAPPLVAYSGGLLENHTELSSRLQNELSELSIKKMTIRPVDGAAAIARQSAQSR